MNSKTPLYVKLKNLRMEHNMSQKELADYLNVSRQAVSLWETGKNYPDIDNLISLCHLYHISLDTLVENEQKSFKKSHDYNLIIRQLLFAILATLASPFAIIGMIISTIILCIFRRKETSITLFDIYIFFTLILGAFHTYYFIF